MTVNKKPDVPWFGPLSDEVVMGCSGLASLVRISAINVSRAKRTSPSLYQKYYVEILYRKLTPVADLTVHGQTLDIPHGRRFEPYLYGAHFQSHFVAEYGHGWWWWQHSRIYNRKCPLAAADF
ncbi:ral GTPase-activating protein subunit alpha-1-like [Culex quinquefasciatus]|uniref:ral GTPase-activating protein subunit alpha-1-like n=1 Tax=Culex quinquefasciatus TaxID=7176 RepID=UPI0018E3D833|nr:ral GTPase-activating protein subunit alpha-1-like [Culex quinquefasciatus]